MGSPKSIEAIALKLRTLETEIYRLKTERAEDLTANELNPINGSSYTGAELDLKFNEIDNDLYELNKSMIHVLERLSEIEKLLQPRVIMIRSSHE